MTLTDKFIASQGATDEYQACIRLVRSFFGRDGVINGPRDLFAFAKSNGIAVERSLSLSYEGMIERGFDGEAKISLRSGLNKRRERFTLAHELAHWMLQEQLLGSTAGRLFRGLANTNSEVAQEERLANLLAAEVLLPHQTVAEAFDPQTPLRSVESICRRFQVSRTMAVRRVADVCQLNLVFVQLAPYDLTGNLESVTQVDDAIFATSRTGTLFNRAQTRVVGRKRFAEVAASRQTQLTLDSPKGIISGQFEVSFRPDPIPHAFALLAIKAWPVDKKEAGAA